MEPPTSEAVALRVTVEVVLKAAPLVGLVMATAGAGELTTAALAPLTALIQSWEMPPGVFQSSPSK